jgi:hemolysin III
VTEDSSLKPLLRGHFHQAAFFCALGACIMLMAQCHGFRATLATLIYSVCLIGLFGISALYHRPNWKPRARMWMRRLDHAAIFLLIAGTATPVCLFSLAGESSSQALWVLWTLAFLGMLQSFFWVNKPKWASAAIYVAVGSVGFYFLPGMKTTLSENQIHLLVAGGLLYILGALIYAVKFPNPSPRYFGYHEIFHLIVIIAAALHFIVIDQILN